jgi:hypothetical protein
MAELSDQGKEEVLAVTRGLIASIRRVRVIFTNERGDEIWETTAECLPGDPITILPPKPENISLSE